MSELKVYVCNKNKWWVVLLEGILMILFGLIVLIWPVMTALVFVQIAGIFILISSIINLFHLNDMQKLGAPAFVGGMNLVNSIIGILLGILVIWQPFQALELFFIIIGIWMLMAGIMSVYNVSQRNKMMQGKKTSTSYGWMMIILGILFVLFPWINLVAATIIIGVVSMFIGFYVMIASFHIRKGKSITL